MTTYFGERFDEVAAALVEQEAADRDLPHMSVEWHQAQQRREQARARRVHRDIFPVMRPVRWLP